jgi:uncharacterized paraquat-inducible protein A
MEIENVIISTMLGFVGGSLATVFYIVWNQVLNKKRTTNGNESVVCPKCRSKKLREIGNEIICTKCYTRIEKKEAAPPQQQAAPILIPTMITQPTAAIPSSTFTCKHCQKHFNELWKLKKHVGMSHSDLIEV